MNSLKRTKILYWTTTAIIVLFEGVVPAFTSHTELAVEGVRHLGYPDYFRVMLTVFKVAGAVALLLPFVKGRVKEWAYAGFGFTMISACISHWMIDGPGAQTFFPLVIFALLALSYVSYQKLLRHQNNDPITFKPHSHVLSGVSQ